MPIPETEKLMQTQEDQTNCGPLQSLMTASKSFTIKYGGKYMPEFSNQTLNSALEKATNLTTTIVGKADQVAL